RTQVYAHRIARNPPLAPRARGQGPEDHLGPIHEGRSGPHSTRPSCDTRGALGLASDRVVKSAFGIWSAGSHVRSEGAKRPSRPHTPPFRPPHLFRRQRIRPHLSLLFYRELPAPEPLKCRLHDPG